jgi:hypothetical protein
MASLNNYWIWVTSFAPWGKSVGRCHRSMPNYTFAQQGLLENPEYRTGVSTPTQSCRAVQCAVE